MTARDAIEVIRSECYVFNPLNFDRSIMINTALDMAINALKIDEKQILQEIKDYCREHEVCQGCKFDLHEGCALTHVPDEWNLNKIVNKIEKKETVTYVSDLGELFGKLLAAIDFDDKERAIDLSRQIIRRLIAAMRTLEGSADVKERD